MENTDVPCKEILKEAIMELQEPVLFKNMLIGCDKTKCAWKLLEWNLDQLANMFGDKQLLFRVGNNTMSLDPQWEKDCSLEMMTLKEFINKTESCPDSKIWYYFDYKYMKDWFKDQPDILNSLDWNIFGFDKGGNDSTLWIGNKGSHTNCHQDSYGCNLVAQIHGRKQWLLFPPSSTNALYPTRVPYEESTIYSKLNFFSPTKEREKMILKNSDKAKLVTLEPGDVLLVPKGWWHFVESLDLTVSVNMWLPLHTDDKARVNEALVKLLTSTVGKEICTDVSEDSPQLAYCIHLIKTTLDECRKQENNPHDRKKFKPTLWTPEDLQEFYPNNVQLIESLDTFALQKFLTEKRLRFLSNNMEPQDIQCKDSLHCSEQMSEMVLNALCHPDVINKVANLLLNTDPIFS